jgi:ABC-2 type transport system permease protein
MSEMMLIVQREFLERVRTKAFVLGTLLFPVLMLVMIVLPTLLDRGGSERRIVLVDEAPGTVGEQFIANLTTPREGREDNVYQVERATGSATELQAQLTERVLAEEIDGYVVLPADVLTSNAVDYRARSIASFRVVADLRTAASRAVQAERLQQAGLDGAQVTALIQPVQISEARVTARGEEGGDAMSTFYVVYMMAFLIYFMVVFYGASLLRSVLEEKTNRIAEVMVSSVKAGHLMMGKIFGVAGAALLQVVAWGVILAVVLTQSDLLMQRFNVPPEIFQALAIPIPVAAAFIAFFLLGFLFYSAMFAALGAAVNSEQEAQSLQMVVILPLIVPLIFLGSITNEPFGTAATVLAMVPFTSPLAMPMRMGAAPIATSQILLSLAILAISVVVIAWMAGKIYRIGILATGKKPTLSEIVRWMRTA